MLLKLILVDSTLIVKKNLEYINNVIKRKFIIGIRFNRTTVFSEKKSFKNCFAKVFTNKNRSTGVLYVISNDLKYDADYLYIIYQDRWKTELDYKSIKEDTSFVVVFSTKRILSQVNHIFSSLLVFSKLELLKTEITAHQVTFVEPEILKNVSYA